MPADHAEKLFVSDRQMLGAQLLIAEGILDSNTYLPLRDAIIKASLDEPPALIVEVTSLIVPSSSAWAVLTSARWHIRQWPELPLLVVCAHAAGRDTLIRQGISRYMPVHRSTDDAMLALSEWPLLPVRRRARAELTATAASLAHARRLMEEWLTAWSMLDLVSAAKLVVTVLVENVLTHTHSAPAIRLEVKQDLVTIAVSDDSTAPAVRHESLRKGADDVAGLSIIAAMCCAWGNSPTPSGKTVWAVIGPQNRL